jgi:hypothetical protein
VIGQHAQASLGERAAGIAIELEEYEKEERMFVPYSE